MYQPPHNREERLEVMHELIRSQPLGLLVSHGPGGLLANLIPMVLHAEAGGAGVLECHLARANEQWRDLREAPDCLVVFQGPQAYVTPSWYPAKREHGKVVPTWNYVVVQARGAATVIEDREWLHAHVGQLTDHNERPLERPWAVSDAPDDYVNSQLKGIVGVRIVLDSLVGKWKLSQNRSLADKSGTAAGLEARGGQSAAVAALMRERLPEG